MENKTLSLLKLSGASPERRMFWLFRLVVALAIMMLAPQGAKASTETTVYYAIPSSTIGTYKLYVNARLQGSEKTDENSEWAKAEMTATGKTYNGNPIYTATFTAKYDGVYKMQFQLYDGETWKSQEEEFSSTWTGASSLNGKMWVYGTTSSTGIAYTDDTATHTYTVVGATALTGYEWDAAQTSNDMTYNSSTGLYEWTKEGVVYDGSNMEFKVYVDHSNSTTYPSSNWVINSSNGLFDKGVGTYTVKITFNASTHAIAVTCTQTASSTIGGYTTMYLESDAIGWECSDNTKMTADVSNGQFTYVLDASSTTADYVWFRPVITDNSEGIAAASNGTEITVNGDAVSGTYVSSNINNFNFKFSNATYTKYTIIVAYANDAWTVKVTANESDKRKYYAINYGSTTLTGTRSGDVITFSIPQVANTTSGLEFTIGEATSSTDATIATKWGTSTTGDNLLTSGMEALTLSSTGNNTTFRLPGSGETTAPAGTVTIKLNVSTGALTASWTTNADEATKDLYLMIRKANGTWYAHKMAYTRNRQTDNSSADAGENNDKYQNYNIRKDDLEKYIGLSSTTDNYTVQWYVRTGLQSDNTYTYYYPSSTIDFTSDTYKVNGSSYEAYYLNTPTSATGQTSDSYDPGQYYTFDKTDGVSYTFTFNKSDATDGLKAGLAVNSAIDENASAGGYYLIGDFTGTNARQHTNDVTHPMKRYYYKNGIAYEHGTSGSLSNITSSQWLTYKGNNDIQPDSIVYVGHVDKPAKGWSNLYIMPNPAGNTADNNDAWGKVLRPQINRAAKASGSGYQLDGIALNGGLTNYNVNQSLNPNMADALSYLELSSTNEITSYDFSMNITTATYRLVFNKPLPSGKLVLRDYGDVKYTPSGSTEPETRTVAGNGKYRFFRTYYSSDSYTLPDNVDMYAVTKFEISADKKTTTAKLTKLKPTTQNVTENGVSSAKNVLYANTPLVLAYYLPDGTTDVNSISGATYTRQSGNALAELAFTVSKFDNAVAYTGDKTPYFVGTNDAIALPQWYSYTDKDGKAAVGYHYLFGCYRRSAWNTSSNETTTFDLGFWLSTGKKNTYANSAYLELPAELIAEQYLGTSYDMTSATGYSSAKKVPALFLVWDDGENQATGITDVTNKAANNAEDGAWYTLQGVRINRPSAHGVYIHNGKKVIVK